MTGRRRLGVKPVRRSRTAAVRVGPPSVSDLNLRSVVGEGAITSTFVGRVASPGQVTGRTWIYKSAARPTGSVIVVLGPLTMDIAMSLGHVGGVVASIGGITSHPANLLRSKEIPLLVAVQGLENLREGTLVTLDCFAGTLTDLECSSDT